MRFLPIKNLPEQEKPLEISMITTLTVLDLGASFMSLAGPAFHWLWDNKIWFFVLIVTHSIGRATDEINDRVSKLQAKIEQLECGEAYRAGDS